MPFTRTNAITKIRIPADRIAPAQVRSFNKIDGISTCFGDDFICVFSGVAVCCFAFTAVPCITVSAI